MSGLPDASMIERMKVHLTEVRELTPPPFVVLDDSLDAMLEAARLRQLLVNCEYLRDRQGVAKLLKHMTDLKLQAGDDNPRAEELATAYVRAAEATRRGQSGRCSSAVQPGRVPAWGTDEGQGGTEGTGGH